MELKSLQLFLEVAESGGFVTAVECSDTVQSNVIAHIKKRENEISTQILFTVEGVSL